ncbi:hypothetical protein [Streptosporangium amethystogenes]|uniref:hypothetical protein n=1 Tax=Streptosporangium amethystogenes TaxID=2002 RepID=UPI0004C538E0|nr:hypothetical protein [Streptosporangium amethystogenes]
MAHRTRDRQPLLPVLSQHVSDRWHRLRDSTRDQRHNRPPVCAINRVTGEPVKVFREEKLAFWQWAVIDTLRLAGLRAEELTELSHLSIRDYQRFNGEVVVGPSKSDR